MSRVMKLPDVGEGVAEAELLAWHVAVGDHVTADTIVAEVLTDKATVEIYAPSGGVVEALHGAPGDVLAVGGALLSLSGDDGDSPDRVVDAAQPADDQAAPHHAAPDQAAPDQAAPDPPADDQPAPAATSATPATTREAVASPAVRARAARLGIDLGSVSGTGTGGQVVHDDLDDLLLAGRGGTPASSRPAAVVSAAEVTVQPVRGLRRKIAEQLSASWAEIPHITYVDAVDATEVERLRGVLNESANRVEAVRLTLLAFIARAIVLAVADQPQINAHYDAAGGTTSLFSAVHLGIATQTDNGLVVPVVRDAGTRSIDELATEIARLSAAARDGSARRDELGGSTITISSLGALGGLMSTPLLNAPEVAIVGINKLETRPVWSDGFFVPRQMFNISASFDHRAVDGWDAATFVQRVRALLEVPSLLFGAGEA